MRIVQIVNTLSVADGGPARNACELAQALDNSEGYRDSLFWLRGKFSESILAGDEEASRIRSNSGMQQVSIFGNSAKRKKGIWSFITQIRAADIVIVHGYFLLWIPPLSFLLHLLRVPFVITPHGSLTHRQQRISIRKKRVYETLFGWYVRRQMSCFITGSQIEAKELLDLFPEAIVSVGGVGTILPEQFKCDHFLGEPVKILSMSRIADKKRIDISIRAVAILKDRDCDTMLTIAGIGSAELTRRLIALAKELSVSDRVKFIGQVMGPAKGDLYRQSDVFLLPSDDENFGIGFAEAMAHGLPGVVSANVASATNMPPGAGELLTAPTAESVADAVGAVIRSERHKESQIIARRFAENEFAWSSIAAQWLSILVKYANKK